MEAGQNPGSGVFRHEVKYHISEREAYMLAQYFRCIMRTDKHAGSDGQYWIRSLYFDTPGNRDYHDKVNGYTDRRKIRLRIYDTATNIAMLEHKSKRGAFVHKESMPLDRQNASTLVNGNCAFLPFLPHGAAHQFYACFQRELLRPILIIDYERQAFELPFESIRITIDRSLRASMDTSRLFDKNAPCLRVPNERGCILEVKYRHAIPDFIRSILSEIDLTGTSISKYIICRQTLHI
ncbi:MAG TPA: hypothetical protein DER58_12620 [Firmicutes bacterium]|jgi:hypothetical protein|nr:hypothetical protein [Bacillota bacterium]